MTKKQMPLPDPQDEQAKLPLGNRTDKSRNQHVIPHADGWVVQAEGKTITRPTSTQKEAIEKAREIVHNQGSEIVIHSRDGRIVAREVFRNQDWELEIPENPAESGLEKYIETRLFGERPHIRGRRIWVSMIAANAERNNLSVSELAYEFSLTQKEVLAALLYYQEHKDEIDRQDAEEQKLFDEMRRLYGQK